MRWGVGDAVGHVAGLLRRDENDPEKLEHGSGELETDSSEEGPKHSEKDYIIKLQHRRCGPKNSKQINHKACHALTL